MNGTDAASDFSCCVVVPWLRVAEAGAAASDSGGHRIGAPRVHTCAGSCVWCLEAGCVCHVDTRVCLCTWGAAFQDGMVCEHGS